MIVKRKIDLNQYLPQVIGDAKEIKAMQEAENPEFALLWEEFVRFEKDVFVLTAEEYGIRRWVDLMELDVSQMSLEEQRALVILKLNENIPYTDRTLRQMLNAAVGQAHYDLQIDYNNYTLVVEIRNKSLALYLQIRALLQRVKPANLVLQDCLNWTGDTSLYYAVHAASIKQVVLENEKPSDVKLSTIVTVALYSRIVTEHRLDACYQEDITANMVYRTGIGIQKLKIYEMEVIEWQTGTK